MVYFHGLCYSFSLYRVTIVNSRLSLSENCLVGSFSNDDSDGGNNSLCEMNLYFTFECRNSVNLFSTSIGLNLAQAKHAPTAFNIKRRYEKLAIAVHVLQNT